MNERIHFISHQKKQVLLVDLSNCSSAEVEKIARAVPDYVSTQPRGSVLVLSDFTGASLDQDEGPAWYPVMLDLYDYYRDHLLPSRADSARLAALKTAADSLTESVHRDFDDLTAMLAERGGDLDTWRGLIQLLLK